MEGQEPHSQFHDEVHTTLVFEDVQQLDDVVVFESETHKTNVTFTRATKTCLKSSTTVHIQLQPHAYITVPCNKLGEYTLVYGNYHVEMCQYTTPARAFNEQRKHVAR